jgi:hypothetical protein
MKVQGRLLLGQCKHAFIKAICEYLQMIKELPAPLLNYCCSRCFGDQVSLDRQRKALESVAGEIGQELDSAVALIRSKLVDSETQTGIATSPSTDLIREPPQEKFKKRSRRSGFVLLGISFGLLLWSLRSCGILDEKKVVTEDDGSWSAILFIGAVAVFFWGLSILRPFTQKAER